MTEPDRTPDTPWPESWGPVPAELETTRDGLASTIGAWLLVGLLSWLVVLAAVAATWLVLDWLAG